MTYNYPITSTVNSKVSDSLDLEIRSESSITISLNSITVSGSSIAITFNAALSAGEKTILDGIVAAHEGIKIYTPPTVSLDSQDSTGNSLIRVDKPVHDFNTITTHNFCVNGGLFTLAPSATDKILFIPKSECQFENDLVFGTSEMYIKYYIWYPGQNQPIEATTARKTVTKLFNLFELGNEHFSTPAFSEAPTGFTTVKFDYDGTLAFYGSHKDYALARLEIALKDNLPLSGSNVSVSFIAREGDMN